MKVILVLSLVFVHLISDALTVGYKYWDAPFNDEDSGGKYNKSSVMGITLSKNLSEDYYVSGNFLVGTYEQTYQDGEFFNDTFERDIHNLEILVAKSGDIFDYGVGLRSIDWASGGTYSYFNGIETVTGTYGSDLNILALLGYLGYSKSFTDNIGLYAGLSYAIEISSDSEYDDASFDHSNIEAGLYYAGIINEDITATLGFRRLEFLDTDESFYSEGFTFSVAYNY